MEDTVAIIDELIREHRQIEESMQSYEQSLSDLGQARKLEGAKESFVLGRLGEEKKRATQLESDLMTVDRRLEHHFYREEKALLEAFKRHGLRKLASILLDLLTEHTEIRERLAELKESAAELVSGQLSRSVWDAKAWDLRAAITHTRRLVEVHARKEEALFQDAEQALRGEVT